MLRSITDELKSIVSSNEFQAMRSVRGTGFFEDMLKFFDIIYVDRAARIVKDLLLYRRRGLKMLDIGSGFGYFPWICKRLGHYVTTTDVPNEMYQTVTTYLGLEPAILEIKPMKKISVTGKFDVITALKTSFHDKRIGKWSKTDWIFFYKDIRRIVSKKGFVYITSSNICDSRGNRCNKELYRP